MSTVPTTTPVVSSAAARAACLTKPTPSTCAAARPRRRVAFYLGCPHPRWLERSPVPLFVSRRTLERYHTPQSAPSARCLWALDSGGFTELKDHGRWTLDEDAYGALVYRLIEECGAPPIFCAPMDWMCEPWVIAGGRHGGESYAGTGLSVPLHQRFTTENLLYLRANFPHAPWIPILQGWHLEDYLAHAEQYDALGVDLAAEPLVGLGSVCRRESTAEFGAIAAALAARGIALHGFGVKAAGLRRYGRHLASADSMAWSLGARRRRVRLPGCTHRADTCANCLAYALVWRERTVAGLG